MLELATLALIGFVLAAVFVVFSLAACLVHAIVWLVLLPFRILMGLLFIPLLVVKFLIGGVVMLVLAPIVVVATLIGVVAAALAVAVPLIPFLIVGWAVYILARNGAPAPVR